MGNSKAVILSEGYDGDIVIQIGDKILFNGGIGSLFKDRRICLNIWLY